MCTCVCVFVIILLFYTWCSETGALVVLWSQSFSQEQSRNSLIHLTWQVNISVCRCSWTPLVSRLVWLCSCQTRSLASALWDSLPILLSSDYSAEMKRKRQQRVFCSPLSTSSVPIKSLWREQQQQLFSLQRWKLPHCVWALWTGLPRWGGASQKHTLPCSVLHLPR